MWKETLMLGFGIGSYHHCIFRWPMKPQACPYIALPIHSILVIYSPYLQYICCDVLMYKLSDNIRPLIYLEAKHQRLCYSHGEDEFMS